MAPSAKMVKVSFGMMGGSVAKGSAKMAAPDAVAHVLGSL